MNSDLELLLEGIPAFRELPADATKRLEQALTLLKLVKVPEPRVLLGLLLVMDFHS